MTDTMQPAQVQGAPSLPQVNLLPPHVRAKRKMAVVRLYLALAVLVVIFAMILLAIMAVWDRNAADADLVLVQDRNTSLKADQDQYSEVPRVLQALKTHQNARTFGMSTEVLWSPYLAAIASATPADVSIESFSVSQDTVMSGSQSISYGPLDAPGAVAQVTISGRALNIAAVSNWDDQLSQTKGIVDVSISSVEVSDDNGTTYYAVGATFRLSSDAFANQFMMEE